MKCHCVQFLFINFSKRLIVTIFPFLWSLVQLGITSHGTILLSGRKKLIFLDKVMSDVVTIINLLENWISSLVESELIRHFSMSFFDTELIRHGFKEFFDIYY